MTCKITIQMDNDAFADHPASELARIIKAAAEHAANGGDSKILRDINGNTVGTFEIIP